MFHRHISACNLQLHRIRIKFGAKSVKCGKATHHPWSIPGPQDEKNPMDPKQIGFWWFLPHGSGAELRIISSSLFLASYSAFGSHLRSPSWSFRCFFWKKKGLESGLGVCQKGNLKGFLKIILGKLKKMVDLQGLWTICFGQHGGFIIFSDYVLKEMYQPTRGFKWTWGLEISGNSGMVLSNLGPLPGGGRSNIPADVLKENQRSSKSKVNYPKGNPHRKCWFCSMLHACMHVCMHACMYVCTYVCMHACMYVWMYVYT